MSVVRIVRVPALESALARFDGWWSGLSRREQLLLGVMAALLFVVVMVFGVVKPLQAARAEALQDIRTYETLNARIRAAGGTLAPAAVAPAQRAGPPLQVVAESAQSFGLAATAEPVGAGVRATVADAGYDSILAWIADLQATSTLRLQRVQFTRGASPGRVGAVVEFAP